MPVINPQGLKSYVPTQYFQVFISILTSIAQFDSLAIA